METTIINGKTFSFMSFTRPTPATIDETNPDLINIGQTNTFLNRKEYKDQLVKARKVNCGHCPYHRGENSGRKPKDDRYKKVTRDTIRRTADVPEETAEFDVLDTIDPNELIKMSER